MRACWKVVFPAVLGFVGVCEGDEAPVLEARWPAPSQCDPLAPVKIPDLKEELRQTGYRLVIAVHPDRAGKADDEHPPRDLYLVGADGSGPSQLTNTPDREEHKPRTSPDGTRFTYNYGDYVVDVDTLQTKAIWGGYVWTPDGKQTATCGKSGITYTNMDTGEQSKGARTERRVSIADMSADGKWLLFEIRDYLGSRYSIDFMSTEGGPIRKLPNHPAGGGECHPAFSPDGKWTCWNSGGSLSVRRFDPSLPDGTDGEILTLPKEKLGQDPCGRWSPCGRYIAYVKIP
ncbi:MAG: TolB family protein, partial [Planctomycetota bacterium]